MIWISADCISPIRGDRRTGTSSSHDHLAHFKESIKGVMISLRNQSRVKWLKTKEVEMDITSLDNLFATFNSGMHGVMMMMPFICSCRNKK